MTRIITVLLIAVAVAALAAFPAGNRIVAPEPAYAASGATSPRPPNHTFGAPAIEVGDPPANHDFSSGGTGWTKTGSASISYSSGYASWSNGLWWGYLTSSDYTLDSDVERLRFRWRAPTSGSNYGVLIVRDASSGSTIAIKTFLNCSSCSFSEWQDDSVAVLGAGGQTVNLRFYKEFARNGYDFDDAGVQWDDIPQWEVTSAQSFSREEGGPTGNYLKFTNGVVLSEDFTLTDTRIELDYAFAGTSNHNLQFTVHLSSDDSQIGYAYADCSNCTRDWDLLADPDISSSHLGEQVYARLATSQGETLVDNVGASLAGSSNPSASNGGAPVNTSTGEMTYSHTDISIPGKGAPLTFTRTHQSMSDVNGGLGHGWSHNYAWSLRIDPDSSVMVRYPDGHTAYFEEDSGSFTPPEGVFESLEDNGDDTYTLTTVAAVEYNFDDEGALTSIVDRNGNTTTVSYDGSGYLSEVEDAGGHTLTFTVDGSGRITEIEDPLERTVGFEYDAAGDLVEVTDVKGGITEYTYSGHRMTSLTDSNGHVADQNIYDTANRVVEQTRPSGVRCYYYGSGPSYTSTNCPGVSPSPAEGEAVVVDPNGDETTYSFDTLFRTTDIEDDQGNSIHYEYDTENNVTCVTDQLGNKTAYDHDSNGNVTQIIDAENTDANCDLAQGGETWDFSYTASNDIDLATDPLGRQTDHVYDDDGNLTRVVRKDDQSAIVSLTCFERDADGLVTAIVQSTDLTLPQNPTDPCTGHKTLFDYDEYGNQTEVVDPRFSGQQDPPVTAMTYDLGGRLLTVTIALDETATYTYDEQNNVLSVEDNLGNTTSNTYDAKGNLTSVTDANRQPVGAPESSEDCGPAGTGDGVDDDEDDVPDDGCPSAIYIYDDADRLIEVVDALGNSTTYGYDALGNRTSVTNANRQPVGDPETGADCGTAGTGDGEDDDSDTVVDDGCPSILYTYDELNRLESETDALGRTTLYEYDEAGNLIERTDARGLVTAYEYDALNRLTLVEHWDGEALVDDVDYTYDDVGNRLTMVDDTGITEYEYDALDRPTSVTFPGDDTVAYEYDDLPGGSAADYPGRRTLLTYPDTKTVEYTYDEAGNLETVTDWLDNTTTYVYDDAGRLTDTDLPNGVDTDYTYDATGRLESVVNTDPTPATISSFDYTLDAVGNRVEMEDLDGTHSYEYDPLYRLTEVTYPGPETVTYTYDAVGNRLTRDTDDYTYDAADQLTDLEGTSFDYNDNGNQTDRGSDTFDYDHENRLTASDIDSVGATYEYNGDGLRVTRTIDQTSVSYVWDVAASLPVILQDSDGNTYVYGLDLISRTDDQGDQEYYLYDGLGSTTDLTDGDGDVLASYGYDVFGSIRSQTGTSPNEFTFTGEQVDGTDLQFLRARYYDAASGRFLSQDPIRAGHAYAYVGSNPVNLIDPSGTCVLGAPCPDPRPLIDPILDPLVESIPEGSVTIPLIGTISYQLGATCFEYPEACAAAQAARMVTNRLAEEIYSEEQLLEGTKDRPKEGDAFQHCFWSGSITLATDAHRAERITTRYEATGAVGPLSREQRDYDLDNNKRGRKFAEKFGITSGLGRLAATAALYDYCR